MAPAATPIEMPRSFLSVILTLFIGVMITLFVGLGIEVFYPAPTSPNYPVPLSVPATTAGGIGSPPSTASEQSYQQSVENFQKLSQAHNRNVSIFLIVIATLILAISLTTATKIFILADGVLLGGVFILLYGLGRSFDSNNPQFEFAAVTAGLVISLVLTYLKYIKPLQKENA